MKAVKKIIGIITGILTIIGGAVLIREQLGKLED